MTEIIIDGFACEDQPVEPRNFKELFGDPFGDFFERIDRLHEGRAEEPVPEKPRVKGIAEDWFRAELRKNLAKRRTLVEQEQQALASDPTSKQQHSDHRADNALHRDVKKAQNFKQKKQKSLGALQKKLAAMNSKRPKDPAQVKTWTARRQALTKQIMEKRQSIRVSDQRIADKRTEYRGN
uniref:Uncharacterized protein n=1 Tax=Pseudomonas phage HRDY3 TaxID=3236930 RepID=A0AB39CDW5_9VIRU